MPRLDYRDESRRDYYVDKTHSAMNAEQLRTGALLRIADATEKMAASYADMERQRDEYRDLWKCERRASASIARSNASLRGVITRLKRKAAEGANND